MNIATIKQQEDLKQRLAPALEKLRAREGAAKDASAAVAFDAFRSFFGAHGFTVHAHTPNIVTATYGEAAYRLEYEDKQFQMKLSRPEKPTVQIRFVPEGFKGPHVTTHVTVAQDASPVTELTKRVSQAEAALQGPTPTFRYFPAEVVNNQILNNFNWKSYEQFSDLLSALCDD